MSAKQRALSNGSAEQSVQRALSKEFLFVCLGKAKIDAELLDDIAEACEMNEFSALTLASGDLSVSDAADKLFLMEDEASVLLSICRAECAKLGINFGDGYVLEDGDQPAEQTEPVVFKAVAAAVSQDEGPATSSVVHEAEPEPFLSSTQDLDEQPANGPEVASAVQISDAVEEPEEVAAAVETEVAVPTPASVTEIAPADPPVQTTKDDVISKTPQPSGKRKSGIPSGLRPASATTPASTTKNMSTPPSIPRPTSAKAPKPESKKPVTSTPISSVKTTSAGKGNKSEPASPAKVAASPAPDSVEKPSASKVTPRPRSAIPTPPASNSAKTSKVKAHTLNDVGSSDESNESAARSSEKPGHVPSYARPTAAALAKTKKDGEESPTSRPSSARSAHTQRQSTQLSASAQSGTGEKGGIFAAISSRLLRPTASFLSWASGKGNHGPRDKSNDNSLRESVSVKGTGSRELRDSKAQTVKSATKLQPFNLSEGRKASKVLTTEELQLQKAKEEAAKFKARPAPRNPKEATPKTESDPDSKKDKSLTTPEPFRLASAERHQKAQEELAKKVEEERKKELEVRSSFKARSFKDSPKTPAAEGKPPAEKLTVVAQAPRLNSEERVKHYHEVVEPQRKAREEAARLAKEESDKKKKEAEEQRLADERKKHAFHAQPVPDFSQPFTPDHKLAKRGTEVKEFVLETDKRLGKPSPRSDAETDSKESPEETQTAASEGSPAAVAAH